MTVVWLTNHSDKREGESQQTDNGGVGGEREKFWFFYRSGNSFKRARTHASKMVWLEARWELGRDLLDERLGRIVLGCKIRQY